MRVPKQLFSPDVRGAEKILKKDETFQVCEEDSLLSNCAVTHSVHAEANFPFRGSRLFQIGGPSRRFATTDDVIQISTTRARYIY